MKKAGTKAGPCVVLEALRERVGSKPCDLRLDRTQLDAWAKEQKLGTFVFDRLQDEQDPYEKARGPWETGCELGHRSSHILYDLIQQHKPDDTIVVVTHSGFIGALTAVLEIGWRGARHEVVHENDLRRWFDNAECRRLDGLTCESIGSKISAFDNAIDETPALKLAVAEQGDALKIETQREWRPASIRPSLGSGYGTWITRYRSESVAALMINVDLVYQDYTLVCFRDNATAPNTVPHLISSWNKTKKDRVVEANTWMTFGPSLMPDIPLHCEELGRFMNTHLLALDMGGNKDIDRLVEVICIVIRARTASIVTFNCL